METEKAVKLVNKVYGWVRDYWYEKKIPDGIKPDDWFKWWRVMQMDDFCYNISTLL